MAKTKIEKQSKSLDIHDLTLNTAEKAKELWILKVVLNYSQPPIWRRLVIDPNITFRQLAHTLMIACDYEGDHMFCFGIHFDQPSQNQLNFFKTYNEDFGVKNLDDLKDKHFPYNHFFIKNEDEDLLTSKVIDYIDFSKKDRLTFEYDLSSNIKYKIQLEKVIEPGELEYPKCLKAVGVAPSEYEDLGDPSIEKINTLLSNPQGYIAQYLDYESQIVENIANTDPFDEDIMTAIMQGLSFDEHGQPYIDYSKVDKELGGDKE